MQPNEVTIFYDSTSDRVLVNVDQRGTPYTRGTAYAQQASEKSEHPMTREERMARDRGGTKNEITTAIALDHVFSDAQFISSDVMII